VFYKRTSKPEDVVDALSIKETDGKLKFNTWQKLCRSAHGVPHSPLRAMTYRFFLIGIPSWVSVHLVRHHIGCQPYVTSQRNDRTGAETPRSDVPQGALVNMVWDMNANAVITISKARLCMNASGETRQVVELMKTELEKGDRYDQILAAEMGPSCEIYNVCFEPKECGR